MRLSSQGRQRVMDLVPLIEKAVRHRSLFWAQRLGLGEDVRQAVIVHVAELVATERFPTGFVSDGQVVMFMVRIARNWLSDRVNKSVRAEVGLGVDGSVDGVERPPVDGWRESAEDWLWRLLFWEVDRMEAWEQAIAIEAFDLVMAGCYPAGGLGHDDTFAVEFAGRLTALAGEPISVGQASQTWAKLRKRLRKRLFGTDGSLAGRALRPSKELIRLSLEAVVEVDTGGA